jgi:hypothetical protein
MPHRHEKPTIDVAENSTDFDIRPKRNTLRNKMRLWHAKAEQATNSTKVNGWGQPRKRPKPSMPEMPWDKELK